MDTRGQSYYSMQLSRARVLSSGGRGRAEPGLQTVRDALDAIGEPRFGEDEKGSRAGK